MDKPEVLDDDFYSFVVPLAQDQYIRSFVESNGQPYKAGRGYYELTTPEQISRKGDMVVQDVRSGHILAVPQRVRDKMGLSDGATKKDSGKVYIDPVKYTGF